MQKRAERNPNTYKKKQSVAVNQQTRTDLKQTVLLRPTNIICCFYDYDCDHHHHRHRYQHQHSRSDFGLISMIT